MSRNLQEASSPDPAVPEIPRISRIPLSRGKVEKAAWNGRIFEDLNALAAEFIECDFSNSIFRRAYFRDAKFKNCKFTGCQFYDCNFKSANFYVCDLRFVRFYRSQLSAREIIAALPLEANIRREMLQNLRANAAEIGDYESTRLLVLEEIKATKSHYWRAFLGADTYYRQKYSTLFSRISAGWNFAWLYISGFVWGNGERPWNIFFSGIAIFTLLTLVNFWSVMPRVGWTETSNGLYVLEYTATLFFDASPDPRFRGFLFVDYAICAMRYVYVGLYIAVLYKTISHR